MALLAGAVTPVTMAQSSGVDMLADCRIAGLSNRVKCGVVQRPLDPAQPEGPLIDVHFAVVPAIARRKLPDPVFLLAGGPGQSAIELAPSVMGVLGRLGNRRDIVFVDQRGTGRSAPLACEESGREPLADQIDTERQLQHIARCRAGLVKLPYLRTEADLRHFTTPLAMLDLDAVRRHLGAERINLVGASYGTRAALDYQRQFPGHVRRSVIDGVAPADMVLPVSFAADGKAAFEALLAACETDAVCAGHFPRLRADWSSLRDSLPRTVSVVHPFTGRVESFVFTREMLAAAVRGPLYSPALAAGLPAAITEAAQGRFTALTGMSALLSSRRPGRVAMGMHFSVVCAEDMPLPGRVGPAGGSLGAGHGAVSSTRDHAPAETAGGANTIDGSTRLYERVCADWPRGDVPADYYRVPPTVTPVLLLSGGLDPATPPRHGERVAQALGPMARHVVVPHAGHGVMALGCMRDVVHRFIAADDEREALEVDAACAIGIPRPPVFLPVDSVGAATAPESAPR